MKEDFSELVEYLDGKFNKVDERFEKAATKEDVQNLSMRLINVEEGLKEVKEEVADLKQTVYALVDSIDKLAKAVDDLRIEYSAIAMKVDRHEKWFHQIAEKLGLKLEYD